MKYMNEEFVIKRMNKRKKRNTLTTILFFCATTFGLIALILLLYSIISKGLHYFRWDFFTQYGSRFPDKAGIKAGFIGSIYLMCVIAPVSFIVGVGTAIYLEEYAKKNKITDFIQVNISNLAGVPSIVFGLLGLTIFVRMLMLGKSILAAGFTMSLLILPIIIVAAQEAIRRVPQELREASYGMGATKWQTIVGVVLPSAIPGILTGTILALSRAVGETAPLIILGIPVIVHFLPDSLLSQFTTLPLQIYDWSKRPQEEFQSVAASGIITLMIFLVMMNSIAIFIRNKFSKRY